MNITDMLNPLPDTRLRGRASTASPRYTVQTDDEQASEYRAESRTLEKRPLNREAKDGAKFERGNPIGKINFPPFEASTAKTRQQLARFHVFPPRNIASYPRHIPYTSDKNNFRIQTGRDAFEVFQYTFRFRDGGKEWVVMWDYNIGLVRITPFFKCLGFGKTIPAKAIATTPGLKDICYSITGGAIAAQGYWLPFEAAKALAATFCFEFRHALVPVFGEDFSNICTFPDDPDYKLFAIDPQIPQQCKRQVRAWTNAAMKNSRINRVMVSRVDLSAETRDNYPYRSMEGCSSDATTPLTERYEEEFRKAAVPNHQPALRSRNVINKMQSPNDLLSDLGCSSIAQSSPHSSPLEETRPFTQKRRYPGSDTSNDADASSNNLSDTTTACEHRQKSIKFNAQEMRAAYSLLRLSKCG